MGLFQVFGPSDAVDFVHKMLKVRSLLCIMGLWRSCFVCTWNLLQCFWFALEWAYLCFYNLSKLRKLLRLPFSIFNTFKSYGKSSALQNQLLFRSNKSICKLQLFKLLDPRWWKGFKVQLSILIILWQEGLPVATVSRRLVREAVRERRCKDNCTAIVIVFRPK